MKDLLIQILGPLGYPIIQQGSLGKEEPYPDHFFTFWNRDTFGIQFYDNVENSDVWEFDLNFYSVDPDKVNTELINARNLLKAQGWIATGKGYDVASDEPTHTGRGISVFKIQNN